MSRKPRIRTDGAPPLSNNPFAALEGALGELPAGDVAAGDVAGAPPQPPPPPVDAASLELRGKIIVRREKKGRGGKTATVIEGLGLPPDVLQDMAKQLRRSLGCGAHVQGATLVLSGAQTERVRDWLRARGADRIVIGN